MNNSLVVASTIPVLLLVLLSLLLLPIQVVEAIEISCPGTAVAKGKNYGSDFLAIKPKDNCVLKLENVKASRFYIYPQSIQTRPYSIEFLSCTSTASGKPFLKFSSTPQKPVLRGNANISIIDSKTAAGDGPALEVAIEVVSVNVFEIRNFVRTTDSVSLRDLARFTKNVANVKNFLVSNCRVSLTVAPPFSTTASSVSMHLLNFEAAVSNSVIVVENTISEFHVTLLKSTYAVQKLQLIGVSDVVTNVHFVLKNVTCDYYLSCKPSATYAIEAASSLIRFDGKTRNKDVSFDISNLDFSSFAKNSAAGNANIFVLYFSNVAKAENENITVRMVDSLLTLRAKVLSLKNFAQAIFCIVTKLNNKKSLNFYLNNVTMSPKSYVDASNCKSATTGFLYASGGKNHFIDIRNVAVKGMTLRSGTGAAEFFLVKLTSSSSTSKISFPSISLENIIMNFPAAVSDTSPARINMVTLYNGITDLNFVKLNNVLVNVTKPFSSKHEVYLQMVYVTGGAVSGIIDSSSSSSQTFISINNSRLVGSDVEALPNKDYGVFFTLLYVSSSGSFSNIPSLFIENSVIDVSLKGVAVSSGKRNSYLSCYIFRSFKDWSSSGGQIIFRNNLVSVVGEGQTHQNGWSQDSSSFAQGAVYSSSSTTSNLKLLLVQNCNVSIRDINLGSLSVSLRVLVPKNIVSVSNITIVDSHLVGQRLSTTTSTSPVRLAVLRQYGSLNDAGVIFLSKCSVTVTDSIASAAAGGFASCSEGSGLVSSTVEDSKIIIDNVSVEQGGVSTINAIPFAYTYQQLVTRNNFVSLTRFNFLKASSDETSSLWLYSNSVATCFDGSSNMFSGNTVIVDQFSYVEKGVTPFKMYLANVRSYDKDSVTSKLTNAKPKSDWRKKCNIEISNNNITIGKSIFINTSSVSLFSTYSSGSVSKSPALFSGVVDFKGNELRGGNENSSFFWIDDLCLARNAVTFDLENNLLESPSRIGSHRLRNRTENPTDVVSLNGSTWNLIDNNNDFSTQQRQNFCDWFNETNLCPVTTTTTTTTSTTTTLEPTTTTTSSSSSPPPSLSNATTTSISNSTNATLSNNSTNTNDLSNVTTSSDTNNNTNDVQTNTTTTSPITTTTTTTNLPRTKTETKTLTRTTTETNLPKKKKSTRDSLRSTVDTATSTTIGALSTVAGPAGFQFTRKVMSMSQLVSCPSSSNPVEDLPDLSVDGNLLGLKFETSPATLSTYRGSVVGNMIIMCSAFLLVLFVSVIVMKIQKVSFVKARSMLRFPGYLLVLCGIFGASCCTGIGVLLATRENGLDISIGFIGFLFFVILPLVVSSWAAKKGLSEQICEEAEPEDETLVAQQNPLKRTWNWLTAPTAQWKMNPFVMTIGNAFDNYLPRGIYFCVIDIIVAMFTTTLGSAGLLCSVSSCCYGIIGTCTLVSLIHFTSFTYFRPNNSRLYNYFGMFSSFSSFVQGLLTFISMFETSLSAAVEAFGTASLIIGLVGVVVIVIFEVKPWVENIIEAIKGKRITAVVGEDGLDAGILDDNAMDDEEEPLLEIPTNDSDNNKNSSNNKNKKKEEKNDKKHHKKKEEKQKIMKPTSPAYTRARFEEGKKPDINKVKNSCNMHEFDTNDMILAFQLNQNENNSSSTKNKNHAAAAAASSSATSSSEKKKNQRDDNNSSSRPSSSSSKNQQKEATTTTTTSSPSSKNYSPKTKNKSNNNDDEEDNSHSHHHSSKWKKDKNIDSSLI